MGEDEFTYDICQTNIGKSAAVNRVLEEIVEESTTYALILDGDIVLPYDFDISKLVKYLPQCPIIACDQIGDRRHSTNVPTKEGEFRIMKGVAGGCLLCATHVRYPLLGNGYQQEDVYLHETYSIGICTDIKVLHPHVLSVELKERQKTRLNALLNINN